MFYYCCILLLLCGRSLALDRSDFFPDGPDLIMLENDDDVYVPEVSIPSPFPFFGVVYNSIGVSQCMYKQARYKLEPLSMNNQKSCV